MNAPEDMQGGDRRPLLTVDGLDVVFETAAGRVHAVRDISFTVGKGECLAIVGESGSGKSVTARTIVGLTGGRSRVTARRLDLGGLNLAALTEQRWRAVRGRQVGLVLQDALVSLDPLRTVGAEIAEVLRTHNVVRRAQRGERTLSLLADAGIPDPGQRVSQHPHELSGGLRQRALIASALAGGPELLLADEPTTALDVTVQAQVLDLLRRLRDGGTSLLLISHDLAVVARLADRIAVMYEGSIVEAGPADDIFGDPRHPYTRALLDAIPARHQRGARLSPPPSGQPPAGPAGCRYAARCPLADQRCRDEPPSFALVAGDDQRALCWHPVTAQEAARPASPVSRPQPQPQPASVSIEPVSIEPVSIGPVLIEVAGVGKRFRAPGGWRDAVKDVSLTLRAGESVGVVGESGSGKTTLARIILGLLEPDEGGVLLAGEPWSAVAERHRRGRRRRIQAIYQDSLSTFDPRFTVERIIGETLAVAGVRGARPRRPRATALLDQVGLPAAVLGRRPRELSGGQRQRVAIARALATAPDILVCDEPVSALDVSIQAQILDLLTGLQAELGMAMLFISHDLGVIHHVSDRLVVMKDGQVVESGPAAEVFARPAADYTRELLAAVLRVPESPGDQAASATGGERPQERRYPRGDRVL
jgi:peptide/nickel transport system ATP-binding protein